MGDLQPAVQAALNRGTLLYVYDEAAWHGTDDIRDHYPDLLKKAGGFVVSGSQAETELAFYDKSVSAAVYRATFKFGKLTSSGSPSQGRVALTPLEQQMIAAKAKALDAFVAAKVEICSKSSPNIATLPPQTDGGPVTVYVMTPRTDMNSLPLGGHYSVEVSQSGAIGSVRRFTKACAELPVLGDQRKRAKVLMITHLLDPTPTEIHVFSSVTGKIPIYVATTNDRIWAVESSRIRLIDTKEKN